MERGPEGWGFIPGVYPVLKFCTHLKSLRESSSYSHIYIYILDLLGISENERQMEKVNLGCLYEKRKII